MFILALLGLVALGLALGTNALFARLLVVDADKLAAARSRAPSPVARSGSPSGDDDDDRGSDGVASAGDDGDRAGGKTRRPGRRGKKDFSGPITRRNLFDSAATPVKEGPKADPTDEAKKSDIDAVLISTAVASDPIWSTAMVSVASSAAEPYRIGDPLADATVVDIRSPWLDVTGAHHPARIIVLRDGQREYIEAGGKPKPGARRKTKDKDKDDDKKPTRRSGRHTWDGIHDLGGGKYSVEQSEVDYALGNLDKLSREARVVPNFSDGQTNGWKVFSIRRNSALRKMGLKNNDVLTTVNGFDLGNTEKALELFGKLQSEKSFSLEILRNGEPMTLEYSVQ